MPLKSRLTLKSYFETNDTPTSGQYADLIDSIPNFVDDAPTYGFNWREDWDVSTASYDSKSKDVSSQDSGVNNVFFKQDDGSSFYIVGDTNNSIFQYTSYTSTNIKSINGLAYSSVKSYNGIAKASIKSINGLE